MERKPFEDRYKALEQEAQSWSPAWRDIKKYLVPTRGSFDDEQPNQGKKIDHTVILDGHASRAVNALSSGMTSGLTSPSRPWFKLGLADAELADFDPVKEWLDIVQDRMMAIFAKSNIYGALPSVYAETASFGTGSVFITEDRMDVIRARVYTSGEYFLGCGPDGRVNAFARKFKMTVGQIVKQFGEDAISTNVKTAWQQKKADQWFSLIHLIEENDKRVPNCPFAAGMPYRSLYWEAGSPPDTFLRLGGYQEFPVLAPRWQTTTTADVYGRSPGWDCLGDVRMLQKMKRDSLAALDKVVDPPVQADGSAADQVNLLPGGVTRSSSVAPNAGVRPVYQVNPDFNAIGQMIQETKQAINESFYKDLFMMIAQADRPNMTAREIVERHEEKLLMLGPVLERLESELLDPLIDRTFNIMMRMGVLPTPPEELQGQDIKVEYISMLAQAQKMVGTTAIEQTVAFVGNLAAAKPDVLDKLDADEAVDAYAEALGVPPKVIVSKEKVIAIRDKKAQEANAAQAAATLPALVTGAKTLSETKVGQNSALDALLSGAGAPGREGQ
jgi:hypothetical protein